MTRIAGRQLQAPVDPDQEGCRQATPSFLALKREKRNFRFGCKQEIKMQPSRQRNPVQKAVDRKKCVLLLFVAIQNFAALFWVTVVVLGD
jgi:hypothetical protein